MRRSTHNRLKDNTGSEHPRCIFLVHVMEEEEEEQPHAAFRLAMAISLYLLKL